MKDILFYIPIIMSSIIIYVWGKYIRMQIYQKYKPNSKDKLIMISSLIAFLLSLVLLYFFEIYKVQTD